MANKSKYRTVSLPRGVTEDIEALIEEIGYWPSVGAFVREAALDKLKAERTRLQKLGGVGA